MLPTIANSLCQQTKLFKAYVEHVKPPLPPTDCRLSAKYACRLIISAEFFKWNKTRCSFKFGSEEKTLLPNLTKTDSKNS